MKPYFYLIRHVPSGKYYVGSQYGKNSDPKNLFSSYFTSSKIVKKLIEQDGINSFIIEYVDIRKDAREYEQKYLMEMYEKHGRTKFLEIYLNRNLSPGILLTEEIIEKANEKRKISNSISAKKLMEEGRHNFQLKPAHENEKWRKKVSERMLGNNYGSFRIMDEELRNKIANGAKGNTNVRGTKWWTNGIVNKRSKECPGKNFILGTTRIKND